MKRAAFLQALVGALELSNVKIIHKRAEDAGQDAVYRQKYDWVVARGVAAMPVLLEYCIPLVKEGGYFAAYKGPAGIKDARDGAKAATLLGGQLVDTIKASLPENQGERYILIYQKVAPTPARYPRRPGVPAKQPLV